MQTDKDTPTAPTLVILEVLLNVQMNDDESICSAYKQIWHAQLDLIESHDLMVYRQHIRDFDNYDILDTRLGEKFREKIRRLMRWCATNGVIIA